jgi:hypothetical protein
MTCIFVGMPTAGSVQDGKIKEDILRLIADMHSDDGVTVIAPMIQAYQLLPFMNVDASYEVWGRRCEDVLIRSDIVAIILCEGWSEPTTKESEKNYSTGVKGEIATAKKHGKSIFFVDPAVRPIGFLFPKE